MISVSAHNYSSMAMTGATVQRDIDVSIQRLSSGRRINAAKDDVAGMQISTRLNAEIKGLEQTSKNAADAQSLIDTASEAINDAKKEVLRVRELAVQAANGVLSSSDRSAINTEIKQRIDSIDRIALNTSWAGKKLLDGTFSTVPIQISSQSTDIISLSISSMGSAQIGLSNSISISSHPGENNSDDVSVVGRHPSVTGNPSFIRFTNDTTAGMVHWFSNGGGIDPSADPNSKVEILGKTYTVSQGTISEKTLNLQSQLDGDGISSTVVNLGGSLGTVLEVSGDIVFRDYNLAYGTSTFIYYGDPLQPVDGASNDSATLDPGYTHEILLPGYTNNSTPISVTSQATAYNLISLADSALTTLNAENGKVASISNRIDNIISFNLSTSININQASGRIVDADYAKETAEFAKNNILQQATIHMSKLARNSSEGLRTLLKGDSFVHKQNFLY